MHGVPVCCTLIARVEAVDAVAKATPQSLWAVLHRRHCRVRGRGSKQVTRLFAEGLICVGVLGSRASDGLDWVGVFSSEVLIFNSRAWQIELDAENMYALVKTRIKLSPKCMHMLTGMSVIYTLHSGPSIKLWSNRDQLVRLIIVWTQHTLNSIQKRDTRRGINLKITPYAEDET